uniref:Kringle domain-containing protein n=1 Tax=Naja naja TaxID=35670 RepID=A0A8C6XXS7_NAJNA
TSEGWKDEPVPQQAVDCYYDNGSSYRGTTAVTTTGKKCQTWISMRIAILIVFSFVFVSYTPSAYPNNLISNYCRNPDGEPRPWCFTSLLTKRWEFCNIPRCGKYHLCNY